MKSIITNLILPLTILLSVGFTTEPRSKRVTGDPAVKSTDSMFSLERRSGDISIYSRWIKATETRLARQLKVEFTVRIPVEKVISAIRDERSCTAWMKSAKIYCRIKTINSNQWYSYIRFSIPWPLNDQDCILKYNVLTNGDHSRTEISLVSEPGMLKTYNGIKRITHMEGLWVISRLNPHKTFVEYYIFSKQEPQYPSGLTAPLVEKDLLKTMSAFRESLIN